MDTVVTGFHGRALGVDALNTLVGEDEALNDLNCASFAVAGNLAKSKVALLLVQLLRFRNELGWC